MHVHQTWVLYNRNSWADECQQAEGYKHEKQSLLETVWDEECKNTLREVSISVVIIIGGFGQITSLSIQTIYILER